MSKDRDSLSIDIAPPGSNKGNIYNTLDLQCFVGYQFSSSTRSPAEAATERCWAERMWSGDRNPGRAVVAAGCGSGRR